MNISLKFLLKGWINNIPALFQIMAWRRLGDKPLSETMMVSLLTHICITQPQWVKQFQIDNETSFDGLAQKQLNSTAYENLFSFYCITHWNGAIML